MFIVICGLSVDCSYHHFTHKLCAHQGGDKLLWSEVHYSHIPETCEYLCLWSCPHFECYCIWCRCLLCVYRVCYYVYGNSETNIWCSCYYNHNLWHVLLEYFIAYLSLCMHVFIIICIFSIIHAFTHDVIFHNKLALTCWTWPYPYTDYQNDSSVFPKSNCFNPICVTTFNQYYVTELKCTAESLPV